MTERSKVCLPVFWSLSCGWKSTVLISSQYKVCYLSADNLFPGNAKILSCCYKSAPPNLASNQYSAVDIPSAHFSKITFIINTIPHAYTSLYQIGFLKSKNSLSSYPCMNILFDPAQPHPSFTHP
jgi:hypothetical protein